MKILIYGINYWPELAGIGKYTGEMSHWLSSRGHDIRVVVAPPYYPEWSVLKGYSSCRWKLEIVRGVRIYRCPLWIPIKLTAVKRLLHLVSFAISSAPVMIWQGMWRPDLVLVVEPPLACAPFALLAARLSGAKAVLHIQDFEVDAAFEMGFFSHARMRGVVSSIERWLMARFNRISTISNRMMGRLAKKGIAHGKAFIFPNWVDTEKIRPYETVSPLRENLGISDDKVVALYSGNMGEKQGLEVLIEVANRLTNDSSIHFIMCGKGSAYARLRALGASLSNITWLPLQPIEKLNELLNAADIHLLFQRADAADLVMPSKLTGIMASGRPVVATAYPGTEVWEVVQGRGIPVEPDNVKATADAIQKLAADAGLRKSLGMAAREYAVTELDKEQILRRFEAELVKLVEEG